MATTSLWRIKGAFGDVIRYAENEKKTTKEILPEEKAREPTGSGRDGRKYHRTRADYKRMREVSDQLCREERLSVIEENYGHGK